MAGSTRGSLAIDLRQEPRLDVVGGGSSVHRGSSGGDGWTAEHDHAS